MSKGKFVKEVKGYIRIPKNIEQKLSLSPLKVVNLEDITKFSNHLYLKKFHD